MKKLLLLVAIAMLFPGCGSKKDAKYYEKHRVELREKLLECRKRMSKAEKMADRECTAAEEAASNQFLPIILENPLDKYIIKDPLQEPGKGSHIK
ncbi:MAG: EexN family lipoprotein [Syntrophobacterales bacterium]|jgi:hypothetical protein|nr:EexN family lipoprotein [Syntrophobacterales bacterium]